jgi:uncharacterized protein YegL
MGTRPLHFIWMIDCSGSMSYEGKIQQLNEAIKNAIPLMQDVAKENPNASVLVRCIAFSTGARWHIGDATPVEDFKWADVSASGVTDMGHAFTLLSEELRIPPMTERALPPVLALLSDGQPTDDYAGPLDALLALPWGKKAVRVAIAIGTDADRDVLQQFIARPEIKPLGVRNPDELVQSIRWVSTAVLKSASSPPSQTPTGGQGGNVPIPAPPPQGDPASANVVW